MAAGKVNFARCSAAHGRGEGQFSPMQCGRSCQCTGTPCGQGARKAELRGLLKPLGGLALDGGGRGTPERSLPFESPAPRSLRNAQTTAIEAFARSISNGSGRNPRARSDTSRWSGCLGPASAYRKSGWLKGPPRGFRGPRAQVTRSGPLARPPVASVYSRGRPRGRRRGEAGPGGPHRYGARPGRAPLATAR